MILKKTLAVILAILMILTIPIIMPNVKADPTPPTVTTNDATGVKNANATFNGYLDADGGEGCTVGFQYGLTTSYGQYANAYSTYVSLYVYAGGATNQKVQQFWTSNMTKKAETAVPYGAKICAIVDDATYVYAAGITTDLIYQYWKSNMTEKANVSYGTDIQALAQDDLYIYAGGNIPQTINQYWKSNMTEKAETVDAGGSVGCIAVDDTYVYASGAQYFNQYWKSNMTRKTAISYGYSIRSCAVDANYVYVGGINLQKVNQYWKSNMTLKAQSATFGSNIYSIAVDNNYIYVVGEVSRVKQYYKSDLSYKAQSEAYAGQINTISIDGTYAYVGGYVGGGQPRPVYQYWLSNLTKKAQSAGYGGEIFALSSSYYYQSGDSFFSDVEELASSTLYHYRTYAINGNSTVYGSDKTFRTKPNGPTGLTIANTAQKEQNISWIHGTGYAQSVVKGNIGSYPADPQSGTAIYNGTNNYVVRTNITAGTDWYYRAWEYDSYNFSDTYSQAHLLVTAVVTGNATNIAGTSVTLNGNLIPDDGTNYTVKFEYGSTTSYGNYAVPYTNYLVPYLYAGGWTSNNVWQWRTSNGTKVAETVGYGNVVDAVADDSTYVYYGGRVIYTVCKAWKSNMTKICESSSYGDNINSIAVDDNYVYVGGSTYPSYRVNVYWKSNLTYKGQTATSYGSVIYCVTVDDTYIYVGGGANTVKRYLKSDLTETTGIASVGQSIYRIVVDNKYIFTGDNDGMVRQYWKSNLTYITQVNFGAYTRIYGMGDDSDNLYVCGYATTGMLYKYRKSDMAKLAQTAYVSGNWMGIVVDSIYVYAMVNDWVGNGIIRQYWKSNLTQKTTFTPYSGSPVNLVGNGLLQAGDTFSSNIANLLPDTSYHYRAVSNNANGTSYGLDKTFKTPIVASIVVTNNATSVTDTTATLNGNLLLNGGGNNTVNFQYGKTTSYGNATFNMTVTIGEFNTTLGATHTEAWTHTQVGSQSIYAGIARAESFKFKSEGKYFSISSIGFYGRTNAQNSPNMYLSFREATSGGLPTGPELYNETVLTSGWWSGSPSWHIIPVTTSYAFDSSKKYCIIVGADGGDGSHRIEWYQTAWGDNYANGTGSYTSDGVTWYDMSINFNFKVFYQNHLEPGTLYHYRAVAHNSNSTVYGSDTEFMTKPALPTMTATVQGFSINLSWIKGTGANTTIIEYKKDDYTPWTRGTGTLLYNGTGTYYLHQNLPKATYYYQIWSYAKSGSLQQWSDMLSIIKARPDGPDWQSSAYYIYAIGSSNLLKQFWANNMTYTGQQKYLYSGGSNSIVTDDTYIYAQDGNEHMHKYWQSNLTDKLETTVDGISPIYVKDDTYLYRSIGTIQKIRLSDLTLQATSQAGNGYQLAVDDTYVYAGGTEVHKYLKSDMSYVGESASESGTITFISVDPTDNRYIYWTYGSYCYKAWRSNLTKISNFYWFAGQASILSFSIDDEYIYVGGPGGGTWDHFKMWKYWKSNMTLNIKSDDLGAKYPICSLVDNTYLYVAMDNHYLYKYLKSDFTQIGSGVLWGTGYFAVLAMSTPLVINLVSPSDGSVLSGQTSANLTVGVSNFESPVNITFYNASNNAILKKYTATGNGTKYFNWIGLSPGLTYSWYVIVNGTFENLKSSTWSFTPFSIPATNNFRIETINDNNITIKWDNPPQQAWIAFSISSKLSEVRQILGSSQEWFVPNLLKNTLYNLQWQIGDNYSAMSDYNDFNFSTNSWESGLNNFAYKKLVTIDHTGVGSDKDNYALNLTLTDENFRYSGPNWWDPSYPGFTHMNYTSKNDFRFVNYYETNYLDYNITNWNVPGDGGVSIQVLPDDTYYTGNFSTPNQAHDNDWFTQATPAPNGVLYYNYTIPVGAKTTSKFRTYQGEWIWDVTLPEGAYGGSELLFKSECDYDTPYVATYAWNYSSASWYLIQNDTARYFYESQMSWEYDASATIYVIPEHFDDAIQTNVKGIDGDYDTKFWMYYGNLDAVNNESELSYSGVYNGAFTIGTEETYAVSPPVISNVVNYNGTSTSMNVTWDTDEIANGRIRYATNQWMLGSTWVHYNVNKTEVFSHLKGDESHVVKLYTYSPYYVQTVDVTCSYAPYSNNPLYYWINHSTGNYPAEMNINATAQIDFLNWTITYTYNKTIEWNTYNSDFMMANLPTDTKYYYRILAIGEGGNTTYDGDFTLGTPPSTPHGNIYSYDEDRPNVTVTILGNLTDTNGNPFVNCSIQYWNETSTDFSETTATQKNAVGTFSKTITVDYGHTYNYRLKMVGSTTGYSEVYTNDYMQIQEFFAGSYIEDDDNNGQNPDYRDREYRPTYPNGTVDLTAKGYIQYGYWEGSCQEEDWMWVETNITDKGILTLHLYTKELGYMGDYVMNVDTDSSMRYIKLTNLQNYWYTFYITGSGSQMVLNWTKPSLIHREHESRTDESKYVSFNAIPSPVNYTLAYLDSHTVNTSAYRWSIASGLDLYSAMVVEYWGGGRESGLTAPNTGTEYDGGQLFRGGVWDGEPYDTGTLEATPNDKPMGTERYCFAFTDYYWNISLLPSNNITNYYYHYWTLNKHYSAYLGYPQDRLFDYNYLYQWKYDLLSYTRDWTAIPGTEIYQEKRVDNAIESDFNSSYNQSLLVGYKSGFNFDPSNDNIWNFGLYTDGRWTNQQIGKYQQAFIIFNLPDNTTLQGMDSDGDNLTDYEELFVYYTNPKSNDTDEDGFNDGLEVNLSRDPNLYTSTPTTVPIVITNNAIDVTNTTAKLNGELADNGGETCTVRFEYGTNTSYGTPTVNKTLFIGDFSTNIKSGTYDEYYYHADAYWDYEEISGASIRRAETFSIGTGQTYKIVSIKLNGIRVQSPPELNITIKEVDLDGNPTGPALSWRQVGVGGWADNDWLWHTITMTGGHAYDRFQSGKKYVFIINCPGGIDDRIRLSKMNGSLSAMYANGTAGKSFDSGATWTWYNTQCWNFEIDYTLTGDFNPGTLYHYRAIANNSVGIGYGSDNAFLTKPNSLSYAVSTAYDSRQINLTWAKGTGANNTYVERNASGATSWSRGAGILVYNGTSTSFNDAGLGRGTNYYYQLWSYTEWTYNPTVHEFSDNYISTNHRTGVDNPTVITNDTTNVGTTTATMNGYLNDDGGESCNVGFEWGKTANYGNSSFADNTTSGHTFFANISSNEHQYQEQTASGWDFAHDNSLAQTFTVGYSGDNEQYISYIWVALDKYYYSGSTIEDTAWTIRPSRDSSTILTSGTLNSTYLTNLPKGTYIKKILFETPIKLTAGTYCIQTIYNGAPGTWRYINWLADSYTTYGGGSASAKSGGWNENSYIFDFYFDFGNILLIPGTIYHYCAIGINSNGTGYGSDKILLTKPNAPTGLFVNNTGIKQQTLTWTHGTGYDQSVVRGNIGSYPGTPQSGEQIYNDTGNTAIVNNLSGDDWYYRVWEYASESGLYQFSNENASNHSIPIVDSTPNQPTNEYPANNSVYITPETYMNVTVSDPDGDNMTVVFKWQNGTIITTLTGVANNSVASIWIPDYQLITHDTTYHWYVVVDDGIANTTGPIWNFHTSKAWDLNGDKTVNYLDVSNLVSHYGQSGTPGWIPADINSDGFVNYLDVSSLVSHYGESY